uniref:Major facilitator superfamily associated domain-containing protein n=1 Tax=Globisporangium ultimum (strain ATCC 200006 / CBS 805.95 / DAOM BR144) TaxID=431595 RepID=K3WNN5_GLOUD
MDHVSHLERISNPPLSSLSGKDEAGYANAKTPDTIEGGALRPGGQPNLWSFQHIGLVGQYMGIGIVYGILYRISYPFLTVYLRMSGVETASAGVLILYPWTLKMFIGLISDCFPIFGYRRRPYVVGGWLLTFVMCFIMIFVPTGDPYFPELRLSYLQESEMTDAEVASLNRDAPQAGVKFIVMMVIANLGLVVALTASDGVLVELGQREPESVRGTAMAATTMVQQIFYVVSAAIMGFGMNSDDYGGTYSWAFGFNGLMVICAVSSLVLVPISWYCIQEERVTKSMSFKQGLYDIYQLIHHRVMYQYLAFRFFRNVFSYFSVTADPLIQVYWARVTPLNSNLVGVFGYGIGAIAAYWTARYGLNWNWRTMIALSQVFVIILDAVPTLLTIWNVYRSQWFWLGGPLLETVPSTVGYIVSTFVMTEIIEEGKEAGTFGLISTVATIASPFSTVLYKNVCANFDLETPFILADDTHVHTELTYAYIIAYAFQIFSLALLVLLPRQKVETQEMKRNGGTSKLMANITVAYLTFAFLWSLMTNIMTFSSTTSCLKIAGGSGC